MRGWGSTAATLAPLAAAYRVGAADATAAALKLKRKAQPGKKGKSVSNRRSGMLMGLLAAGVALGAAGAMMARKRRQQWSEYDPSAALDAMSSDARSMMGKAASRSGATMDKLSHRTSNAMDKTAEKLQSAASTMRKPDYQGMADEAAQRAGEARP
jgi:hypothetical protein